MLLKCTLLRVQTANEWTQYTWHDECDCFTAYINTGNQIQKYLKTHQKVYLRKKFLMIGGAMAPCPHWIRLWSLVKHGRIVQPIQEGILKAVGHAALQLTRVMPWKIFWGHPLWGSSVGASILGEITHVGSLKYREKIAKNSSATIN